MPAYIVVPRETNRRVSKRNEYNLLWPLSDNEYTNLSSRCTNVLNKNYVHFFFIIVFTNRLSPLQLILIYSISIFLLYAWFRSPIYFGLKSIISRFTTSIYRCFGRLRGLLLINVVHKYCFCYTIFGSPNVAYPLQSYTSYKLNYTFFLVQLFQLLSFALKPTHIRVLYRSINFP